MTVDEVLAALEHCGNAYPWAAMDAAVAQREAITPLLLALLEEVLADPGPVCDDLSRTGHLFAVALLTHFRETRAHSLIVSLFGLPEEQVDALFDDLTTESLPGLLYGTCGGDLSAIRAMLADENVLVWSRMGAADALALAVGDGDAGRVETLALLREQLEALPPESHSEWGEGLVSTMLDLCPDTCHDALTAAVDDGVVSGRSFDEEDIDEALAGGEEKALDRLRAKLRRQLPEDVHAYLHWGTLLDPVQERPKAQPTPGPSGKGAAKERQRKKMAKRSKRKNRKKK